MRIGFMISGGFTGAVRGCWIDTPSLDAEDRRKIESLAETAGLEGAAERFSASGRDLRHYAILVERDGGSSSLLCDERSVPETARAFVAALAARATPRPPSFADAFPRPREQSENDG